MVCYTIGHSTRNLNKFITILEEYRIDYVIDIRSKAITSNKYTKKFNRGELENKLKENKIKYFYLGKELGEIRKDGIGLDEKINVDFDKVIECNLFKKGIHQIIQMLRERQRVVLMCSERNPLNCHRSILVGYALSRKGIFVDHIIDENVSKSQSRIEEEIFLTYEPILKNELVKISMQDILNSTEYDDVSPKDSKRKIIEYGYNMKWKEIISKICLKA
ncbi:DUF488 domain-containing protein [Clostridium sp. MB40-C1]|uniref:DUF488 domain-containing protein n=1 Tax=Clostridium sp. MB40-C1 TaxID=3070996 RepID=UPI0027DEC73B|nr:DUF488 domain-containing protein [Clostridium sp. MB40-C1]WMJ79816.1 DUF488 domain-containing protein [Clostridium sp. MB40-C1]